MLQNNLYLENECLTETQPIDFTSTYKELPVEQSHEEGTFGEKGVLQSNSNYMSLEDDNQTCTEVPNDELSSYRAQLALVEPVQSKASFCGGLLLVWGCGEFGQHGHGHTEDVLRGDALGSPLWLGQDRMINEVACGSSHTMVLTDDNKMYSWGNSNSGQLGMGNMESSPHPRSLHLGVAPGTKLKGVTCGTRHSFVWTQDGDCFSFGNNYSGQLGYDFWKPDFKENQLRPVFVDTLLHRPVSQVACGARHSVFLFTNGQVAAVGVNSRGQIGCGDTVDVVCAKTIPELPPVSVIACGNSHSLAADVYGCVYAWGYGKACGSKTDILLPSCVYSSSEQDKIVDLAGGDSHSLILLSSGTVYSWGNNFEGQLGQGRSVKFVSEPKELTFNLLPGKVVSMSVGENTCAAVTDDGMLYMWGKNASQVIRDDENSRFFQFEPHLVSLGVWKALKVSCGSWHVACVVFAAPKGKIYGVTQEKSEAATVMTINIDTESVCGPGIRRDEQGAEMNQHCREAAEEEFTLGITNRDKEQLLTHDFVICDGSKAKDELVEAFDIGEEKHPENQNRERGDNSTGHGFINKTDVDDESKAQNSDGICKGPAIDNSLEEKPAVMEKETEHPCTSEEKPVIVKKLKNPSEITNTEDSGERYNTTPVVPADEKPRDQADTSYHLSQEFALTRTVKNEQKQATVIPAEIMELKQPIMEPTRKKESDKCDVLVAANSSKSESTCEEENKVAVEHKANASAGLTTRTRTFSEHANSAGSGSHDISVALHSGSLDNLRLYPQQDSAAVRHFQSSRVAYSPPANPRSSVGHLTREKRPARMLRQTFSDVEYHLPNQPVHTVDIGLSRYVIRPHPPMNRTQSSPSLYSSNLIRSPLGARKKSSMSAKVPTPPTVASSSDGGLPPKPPARGNRPPRPLEFNPMFSSGTSWRKR